MTSDGDGTGTAEASLTFDGSILDLNGVFIPRTDDSSMTLGTAEKRWGDVFATQTTTGGIFETNLRTEGIGKLPTGTILVWDGKKLIPCEKNFDTLVMGVSKQGKDEPIILGAEPILVTGKVNVGDWIVTSDVIGHGKSVENQYLSNVQMFGSVIAQSLESGEGESFSILAMIRKV